MKKLILALAFSALIVPVALAKDHDKGEHHEHATHNHGFHEHGGHHHGGFWRGGVWEWGPDCYVIRDGIRVLICD